LAMASPPDAPPIETQDPNAAAPGNDETQIPPTTEQTPPYNGGFVPPEVVNPSTGDDDFPSNISDNNDNDHDKDNDNPEQLLPPEYSPPVADPVEGTLSFFFSLETQVELDYETSSMLDVFITSPRNNPRNIVAVQTPQLPDEVRLVFVSIVFDALRNRGIEEQRLTHIIDPTTPLGEYIEVNLYYIPRTEK